jgi:predicted ATPase
VRATPLPILRRHVIDLDGLGELAQLVPELTTRIRLATDDPAATLEGHRYRMFEACALLLRATSRSGPVLLVIDDVQWADRGSLLLLRHLVRSTREAAVCIVLNYRDDEINRTPNATDILEDIVREDSVTRIALTALTEDDVRAVTSRSTSSRARRWAS